MNVALAAEESAGLQMLSALARSGHRVVVVLTAPPETGSSKNSLWNAARDSGFETLPAELVKGPELAKQLRSRDVDILLNVHSLHIIHRDVLAAPRLGAFNLHPGPLPRYAGLNSISWALFRGEQTHGVTVHRMEPRIDAGPIVYQSIFQLDPEETGFTLTFKCIREGIVLMQRLLDVAAADPDAIPLIAQDLSAREYFGTETPEGGRISWSWPASKVVNFVRACDFFPFASPWGHPCAFLTVKEVGVAKARLTGLPCDASPGTVGQSTNLGVLVACRDEWVLASKLHVDGKYVPAQEFLKSGDRFAVIAAD